MSSTSDAGRDTEPTLTTSDAHNLKQFLLQLDDATLESVIRAVATDCPSIVQRLAHDAQNQVK